MLFKKLRLKIRFRGKVRVAIINCQGIVYIIYLDGLTPALLWIVKVTPRKFCWSAAMTAESKMSFKKAPFKKVIDFGDFLDLFVWKKNVKKIYCYIFVYWHWANAQQKISMIWKWLILSLVFWLWLINTYTENARKATSSSHRNNVANNTAVRVLRIWTACRSPCIPSLN